jgi:hypothetical protein
LGNRRRTNDVSILLDVLPGHLHSLIRSRRMPPPLRDSAGDFWWSEEDIQRARDALKIDRRRKKAVPA